MSIIRPTTINARFSQPVGIGKEKLWLCPTLGGDRLDLSGNGNHGTYNGGMGTVADTSNGGTKAYSFDGSDDYIGGSSSGVVGLSAYSVALWYNTANTSVKVAFNAGDGTYRRTCNVDNPRTNTTFNIGHQTTASNFFRPSSSSISANTWQHLVYTFDGSTFRLYIDGSLDSLHTSITASNVAEDRYRVGSFIGGGYYYSGYLDDIRTFDRALSTSEIKHLASKRGVLGSPRQPYDPLKRTLVRVPAAIPTATKVGSIKKPTTIIKPSYQAGYAKSASESASPHLWDGLIGAWMPSLGVTGDTLRDVSGNGNHGTLTNMDAATDWVVKESNQSVEISGGNSEHINISNSLTNSDMKAIGSGDHTIISNVYNLATFEEDIIGSDGIGAGNVLLMLVSSRVRGHVWLSSGVSVVDSHVIGTNKWMQVVQRAKFGETLEVYVDGKRSASTSLPNLPFDKGAGFLIGARYAGYRGTFLGNIGSTFAYNRALTPQEIKQLYVDSLAPFRKKQRVSVAVPAGITFKPYWAKQSTQVSGLLK